jgi:hypothetical protein
MLVDRIARTSERFLSTRSFELIVAPAVADLEYEERGLTAGGLLAIGRAVIGAVVDDITNDPGQAAFFFGLALIPAFYYAFLFLLCIPMRVTLDATTLALAGIVVLLSVSPAIACYWPEPLPKRASRETP